MTRKESREQAFILLFEQSMQSRPLEEALEEALDARDFAPDDFCVKIVSGAMEEMETLDTVISKHIKGWSLKRLPKVTLAILRVAVYEILYMPDVPVSVSINEAVELAKTYADQGDAPYINGVLSAVEKQENYEKYD